MSVKKRRLQLICMLVCIIVLGLLSCNTRDDKSSSTGVESKYEINKNEKNNQEINEQGNDALKEATEEVKRSLLSLGNTYRIHKVLDKMKQGEETTIAFLGGSITEGYLVNNNQNYVTKTTKWLQEKFENENIKSLNAGLSGTSSTIGLLRVEQDVLSEKPDIIVIEFAVNDAKDTASKMAYESLVKRCLEQENEPAIILLFTVLENGYTCEEEMKQVGDAYELPMLSVKSAITEEIEAGTLAWSAYAQDEAHPNKDGHTMISEYLSYYFESALVHPVDTVEIDYNDVRAYGAIYSSMKFYNNQTLYPKSLGGFIEGDSNIVHFPKGWIWGKEDAGSMKFTMTGKNLFILYKEDNSENMGTIEVYIDGKRKEVIHGNDKTGWNNPEVSLVLNEIDEKEHEVEIIVQGDSINKNFHILGFGTTGEIHSEERVTPDMIPLEERAILNVGNTKRIEDVMLRAEKGEDITIGFIGGSITMGSGASTPDECYAKKVYEWWGNTYPNANFSYINAGIGATTSQFACARVQDDLLQYKPDVIVVEFSVNDESSLLYKDSYESLLRTILSSDTAPAVIVLNMVSYNNGNNVQEMHNGIAKAYELPIVSMKESVFQEIMLGNLTASDVSGDNLHPNDLGHSYGAKIVTNYLDHIKQKQYHTESDYILPEPLGACKGMSLTRYNNQNTKPTLGGFEIDNSKQNGITDVFKRGYTAKNTGDSIVFEVTGGNISLQYKKTNTLGAPKAIAIIDGNEENAIALDGNFPNGWGDWLYMHNLLVDGENTTHTVEIRIAEGADREFYLVSVIAGE